MSRTSADGRLLSFDVNDDERLIVGAISGNGDRRTIYEGAEPDEYALVPTRELVREDIDTEEVSKSELRIDDLRIVGPSHYIGPNDDEDVEVEFGDQRMERGAPGVYGLLWIPLAEL